MYTILIIITLSLIPFIINFKINALYLLGSFQLRTLIAHLLNVNNIA